jgi:hypothetical protein
MITKRDRLEAMAREWRQYADSHSGERAETFAHCSRVLLEALRGSPVPHTTLMADRPEQAPQADELAELRRFVDHARAVVNAAIEMYPHARSSKLNDALDAMNTEALRQATKPQQAPHGALGVAEMAQMLTTARAPDRCTPFEHEVTGLPFSGTSKPDKPGT